MKEFLPNRPVSEVETMEDVVKNSTGYRRLPMLLLSAVGIMGVVSYSVTQRLPELGIRMALGWARAGLMCWDWS